MTLYTSKDFDREWFLVKEPFRVADVAAVIANLKPTQLNNLCAALQDAGLKRPEHLEGIRSVLLAFAVAYKGRES